MTLQIHDKGEAVNLIGRERDKSLKGVVDKLVDVGEAQHGRCGRPTHVGREGSIYWAKLICSGLEWCVYCDVVDDLEGGVARIEG